MASLVAATRTDELHGGVSRDVEMTPKRSAGERDLRIVAATLCEG